MKALLFPALLSVLLFIFQIFVDVRYSFVSDPFVKAIQIESLRLQNYSTQEFYYPARDSDLKAEFQPMPRGFVFYLNKKILAVFPIGFAYLYSLLPLNVQVLPYTNFIVLFLLLFALKKYLNLRNLSLILFSFGTVVFPISFDLSENLLFLLLVGVGFLFFIKFLESKDKKFFIYSSSLLSLSIWFRLEALIFYGALVLSLGIFIFLQKFEYRIIDLSYGILSFLALFLIFAFYNYYSYGHFLGTRYIANFKEERDFIEQAKIFVDIIFTRIENGVPMFGFFFYSPILLFSLILLLKKFKELAFIFQYMAVFSIILILGIALSAPNNGITITGRYLSIATFPLIFLLDKNWNLLFITKVKKIFSYSLLVWTFLVSLISLATLKLSFKNVKEYQHYFQTVDTNFWIFTSRASAGFVGFEYLKKKILAVESPREIKKLYKILQMHNVQSFTLFFLDENLVKQNEIYQYKQSKMLSELSEKNYTCTQKEAFQQLTRFDCIR